MVGAPIPVGGLRRRVESLERELRDLRRQLALRDKPARLTPQWNLFLARTIAVDSYPAPPANVFGIQFLTPTFTREEGEQTPTYEEHSAEAYDLALSPTGYVEEGTVVCVHRTRSGQYVIIPSGGGEAMYIGKTSGAIASESTGTVVRHNQLWEATEEEFTVLNPHDIELPDDLKVRWTKYPGWTDWIVEPWHWTECPPEEEV